MKETISDRQQSKAVKAGLIALGIITAVQIAALALKITGAVDVSWGIVLIPAWLILLFILAVITMAVVIIKKETSSVMKKDKDVPNRAARRKNK